MTAPEFQMPLDGVLCYSKASSDPSCAPSLCVEEGDQQMIFVGQLGGGTAPHVHGTCNWLDMFGIDTETNSTQVVGLQSIRPASDSFFPDGTMGHHLLPLESDLAISSLANGSPPPYPARCRKATIFNGEVAFVNHPHPERHIVTAYITVQTDGYETP